MFLSLPLDAILFKMLYMHKAWRSDIFDMLTPPTKKMLSTLLWYVVQRGRTINGPIFHLLSNTLYFASLWKLLLQYYIRPQFLFPFQNFYLNVLDPAKSVATTPNLQDVNDSHYQVLTSKHFVIFTTKVVLNPQNNKVCVLAWCNNLWHTSKETDLFRHRRTLCYILVCKKDL